MRPLLSIPLLTLLLLQILYLPGLSLWLEWNRSFIAGELCVNVDQPELLCSGRCYISNQMYQALEESPDDEVPAPAARENHASFFQFIVSSAAWKALALSVFHPSRLFFFQDEPSALFSGGVFRPPSLLAWLFP
ncbi:MAG: hypothetical protein KDD10_00795 [Phaeodactylibacter sp.]|nr:hypothetical protein [Phaeodactylibacter sp.]MCB9294549.1 hypothetical protein [Lewinellaceae bacterium]